MRLGLKLTCAVAVLTSSCDRSVAPPTEPANGAGPEFSVSGGRVTVTLLNERYRTEQEAFPLCDGGMATGEITWHEIVHQLDYTDGSSRIRAHLNMAGGRATGPDGAVYVLQQVNRGGEDFEATSGTFDFRFTTRIAVISPGRSDNLFLNDVTLIHFDPAGGYSSSHTREVTCHG